MSTEHAETMAALELVAFRRLGANRVHFALVMPGSCEAATHWSASCTVIRGVVKAWCGRTLKGDKFVIPAEHLDGWKRQGHVCRECQLVGQMVLREAR